MGGPVTPMVRKVECIVELTQSLADAQAFGIWIQGRRAAALAAANADTGVAEPGVQEAADGNRHSGAGSWVWAWETFGSMNDDVIDRIQRGIFLIRESIAKGG
jgi:hypothetical protein